MASELEQLVGRAATGDTAAFCELVARYKTYVYAYILPRVGDYHWADDIAQETFIAAFQGLSRMREPAKFAAWLRGIAENMCAMWLRRTHQQRRLTERMTQMTRRTHDKSDADGTFEQTVLNALGRLSDADAAAVTLYYCDGLTQRQCAEFLGVSGKAFESRLGRARRKLRQEVLSMTEKTLKEHSPDDSFDRAVIEEIDRLVAVVGGRYKKGPVEAAEDRLAVLFSRNEERLGELIASADNETQRIAARRMVRLLGAPGVNRALGMVLGAEDEQTRLRALAAIPTWPYRYFTYTVIEAIHEASFSDEQKIRLLIELIRRPAILTKLWTRADRKDASRDSSMYMELMMGFGDIAAAALVEEIRRDAEAGRAVDPWLGRALVRFGTASAETWIAWIESDNEPLAAAGARIAEILMVGLCECFARRRRGRRKGGAGKLFLAGRGTPPPLAHPDRTTDEAMAKLASSLARAVEHPSQRVAVAAASALGRFTDHQAFPAIARALESGDEKVAGAAALSLGQYCSIARIEPLTQALETAPAFVKGGAVNALRQIWSSVQSLLGDHDHDDIFFARRTFFRKAPAHSAEIMAELEAVVDALDAHRERIVAALEAACMGANPFDLEPLRARRERILADRQRRQAEREAKGESELTRRARDFHRRNPDVSAVYTGVHYRELAGAVRMLPEDREYGEKELNRLIAQANADHSYARCLLCETGWMTRKIDRYRLTDLGRQAWRVEREILAPACG